ncbi:hypothetical protein MMC13_002449 [Lambiella insularis]|nr:hypothetical protein [Lambiella insularis]
MAERTPTRHSSASSRHSLRRPSNPDVFSDEYALDMIPVSDGFRPSAAANNSALSTRSSSRSIPRRPVAPQPPPPLKESPKRKKGLSGYGKGNSVSSRHNASAWHGPGRTPSTASTSAMSDATTHLQRQLSVISGFSMPRVPSPYQGATGPSHPYAMYPQDTTLNRTSTVLSVRAPERSYTGPSGPMHPYGMYPQNTVPEGESSADVIAGPVAPIGFPGLGQQYTRRLGPDGEEADDIIGPDGHTEQLPPYTRYPDAAVTKESYAPAPLESQEALLHPLARAESPVTPQPVDELRLSDDEHARINFAAAAVPSHYDVGRSTKERWKSRGRKKVCCGAIPRWVVVTVVIVAIIFAAVMGGIIGRLVSAVHKGSDGGGNSGHGNGYDPDADTAPTTVTATAIADATPLPSPPPDLPMLPKGNFGVPLGQPAEALSSCLSQPGQIQAWSCVSDAYMGMNVTPADYGSTQVSIFSTLPTDSPLYYGPQPPVLASQTSLQLVTDDNDPTRGPAYFFQETYDKLVILPTQAFPSQSSKRSAAEASKEFTGTERTANSFQDGYQFTVGPGSKPWYCFWNSTMLEGFIYVTMDISGASQSNTTELVNSLLSSVVASPTSSPASPSSTSGTQSRERFNKRDPSWPSTMPTCYPKIVKMEERRNTVNAVQPYCQQMQILDDMSAVPLPNSTTSITHIPLLETESTVQRRAESGLMGYRDDHERRREGRRRRSSASSCSCEWLSL